MDDNSRLLQFQINAYENKIADFNVEHLRQQITLDLKERELKRLKEETECLHSCTEEIFKRTLDMSHALSKQKFASDMLEIDSVSLAQALQLSKNEIDQRKNTLNLKKIQNKLCLTDLEIKAQCHQTYYDSLELVKKIKELEKIDERPAFMPSAGAQEQKDSADMNQQTNQNSAALERELDGLRKSNQRLLCKLEALDKDYNDLLLKCSESLEETNYKDLLLKASESLKEFDDVDLVKLEKLQEKSNLKEEYMGMSAKCSCGHSFLVHRYDA